MGPSRGRARSSMPVQTIAYVEHTQRNTATLPKLVGLVFVTETDHTPVIRGRGIEFLSPAESSVKRLLVLSKGLFGAPNCGTEQVGEQAQLCDGLPATKQLPVFGTEIATTTGGILCTSMYAWRDSGDDGASHGPPVRFVAAGECTPANQPRAGIAQRPNSRHLYSWRLFHDA